MSAPLSDLLEKKLAAAVWPLVRAEAERISAARPVRETKADRAEREILQACRQVAAAVDMLAQAQFAGAPEIPARRRIEATAKRLRDTMQRHGRFTGLEG